MKNIVKILAFAAVNVILLVSCQDLFTKSVFSFVEIDMSSMTDEQKISYAEDLLSTGTEDELEDAYAEISVLLDDVDLSDDLTDSELELVILGADLAIGASGVGDAVTDALDALTSADDAADPSAIADSILGGFDDSDYENLEDAVELIKVAESNDPEVLTSQQYTNAAAAQLLLVLDDVSNIDGVENPEDLDPVANADIVANLAQALLWAEAGGLDTSLLGDGIAMPTP